MVACLLLFEITTYLRETYQVASQTLLVRKSTCYEKQVAITMFGKYCMTLWNVLMDDVTPNFSRRAATGDGVAL